MAWQAGNVLTQVRPKIKAKFLVQAINDKE